MNKMLAFYFVAALATGVMVWYGMSSYRRAPLVVTYPTATPQMQVPTTTPAYECDGDARICPDGSSVGRTGPKCEFAACPSPQATSGKATTFLGGNATALDLTVSPRELVSDSRCPQGVQCIWAGTVEVKTAVASEVAHGEHVFKLGEQREFGGFSVTLTEVTPYPEEGREIPDSSYRFTFTVEKK